ncbi:unnamed protein product [Adineta steineri]|uniref:L-Fucosyltransferase n=2 Tax=Adineta steineri TaxID=433720 RepID=A0A818J5A1_9BILA|nr:unnamed protein product [Adineta steineri]
MSVILASNKKEFIVYFETYLETPGRSRHVKLGINLYIDANQNTYTPEEKDTNHLTIERFSFCARNVYKSGRENYLYRPRFIQYPSIHQQLIGLFKEQPIENHITLAHYSSMSQPRTMPGCGFNETVENTNIRNRSGDRIILLKYLLRQKMGGNQTLKVIGLITIMIFFMLNIYSRTVYDVQVWKNNNLFNDTKQCRIILRECGGRVGNCLFMFATAYGLSLTHSCQLYITPYIIDELQTSFEMNLTNLLLESQLDNFTSIKQIHDHCSYIPNVLHLNNSYSIELKEFWQVHTYFLDHMEQIREQLRFKQSIAYIFDEKKKNVLVTLDSFSVADDLATLTLCEHTILTAGTFGWWGAFLSHNRLGDVLTDSKSDHSPIDANCRADDYFPSWFKFLNNTN